MGTQDAPDSNAQKGIRIRRILWLPAWPEAAVGLPMREEHGGLRTTSASSVSQW